MELKPGDTVRLKSGGPVMTIAWIEGGEALCEWFSEKKPFQQRFLLTSLVKFN
jgi:uncharacterized protein YodC (DUF2158 family)